MDKKHAMIEICKLYTKVATDVFGNSEPADCFCGLNENRGNFQFSQKVINFVENAVNDAIEKTPKRVSWQEEQKYLHVVKNGNPFLSTNPKIAAIKQYRILNPKCSLVEAKEAIKDICIRNGIDFPV